MNVKKGRLSVSFKGKPSRKSGTQSHGSKAVETATIAGLQEIFVRHGFPSPFRNRVHFNTSGKEGRRLIFKGLNDLLGILAGYSRDVYQHSLNVGLMAERIALCMELPEEQISLIRNAGFLHDIGKIRISKRILYKTTKLTGEEWAVVKKHPEFGVDILSSYPWAEPFLQIVKYHHERWDGSGYFTVLGDDIPLGARILAVADALDAMTSSRPYQKSKDWQGGLKELKRCDGSQFDPLLVNKTIQFSDMILQARLTGMV